jgi:hypothetical protein
VEIFCVKTENFLNIFLCFAAFLANFRLLVFADSYQEQGETLPKFTHTTSPRGSTSWVMNPFPFLLIYCISLLLFQLICFILYKHFFISCPTCLQGKGVWLI